MKIMRTTFAIATASCAMFIGTGESCQADSPSKATKSNTPSFVTVQHESPRIRFVHVAKAVVRSGPSDSYYETTTLKKGASVDVYLETSDGWSGIRPTESCHDWIPSSVAYMLPGGKTAEIISDNTPAWIGSDLADTPEFLWQTSLSKSQQVQILGEQTQWNDEGKRTIWYKISPPQGEFRWIKSSLLSDNAPEPPAEKLASHDGPAKGPQTPSNASAHTPPKPKRKPNTDPNVKLASHAQESVAPRSLGAEDLNAQGDGVPGEVVWSDEQDVLADIQRQIRKEQSDAKGTLPRNGGESILVDDRTHLPTRTNNSARIPSRKTKSNASVASTHQTDAMQQWDAMQSQGQKPRISPIGNVLGLIGISVVEAERAPANTPIAQPYPSRPAQGYTGGIGPVGTSRLDRLPRPGHSGPAMTLPADANLSASPSPYGANESTFSKWLSSREPVFGNTYAMNAPNNNVGMPSASMPIAPMHAPVGISNEGWHGLRGNSIAIADDPSRLTAPHDMDSNKDVDEFQTPEIQSALVQLTREVAAPTENWNLIALRAQASRWIEDGSNAMVRGEARLLMDRIDRFESLRQRTLGFAQNTAMLAQQMTRNPATNLSNPNAAVVPASAIGTGMDPNAVVSNGIATTTAQGHAGDASGWLVQVHTSYPGQPEFALTDDSGNVITYVQSNANLNLRRYLQQPVTVYGLRGYVPNLAAKQILAERVVRVR